jgi:hypothetical protein
MIDITTLKLKQSTLYVKIQVVPRRGQSPSIKTACELCVGKGRLFSVRIIPDTFSALCGQSTAWLVLNPVRILATKL